MKLYRYSDFVNEAKKGLQLSLFPEMVPHEEPEPEAPTSPEVDIDKDLIREYLVEMTDQGWFIDMEDMILRGDTTDVLLPGENRLCLRILFINEENVDESPSLTLEALDNLANDAGCDLYYAPEGCPDEMKKREELGDEIDELMLEGAAFEAFCVPKKPFDAKGQDLADYYGWKLREYSGGPSHIIKGGEVWARLDQIDVAHFILTREKEQTELIEGFDSWLYELDYPSEYMTSVIADLDTPARKVLFDKMVNTVNGLEKLQELIDKQTGLETKGLSEEETINKLFWKDNAIKKTIKINHLLIIDHLFGELCQLYVDMLAESAMIQDDETMQNEFDEVVEKYFTYRKSDEKVTFDSGGKKYTTYIYHIKMTKEMLEWLEGDGCTKADFETGLGDIISNYYYRRYETWELDIRRSEGWVNSKDFSRRAEKIMESY